MKKSIDTVRHLQKYFEAKIVGSQLFVEKGMLHEDDINDIDVFVGSLFYTNILSFMKDNG